MARRWITYKGRKILIEDKENRLQAMARVDAEIAKEEADRREREIAENAERIRKLNEKAERKKTPKYKDMTVVLGKDGKHYIVWEGYYDENSGEVLYEAMPSNQSGAFDLEHPLFRYGYGVTELSQKDIQKMVKKG